MTNVSLGTVQDNSAIPLGLFPTIFGSNDGYVLTVSLRENVEFDFPWLSVSDNYTACGNVLHKAALG